jgi:hypothetical protein
MTNQQKKRNELWKKLFTMRIEGESFIQSPSDTWNSIEIPKWRKVVAATYADWVAQKIDLKGIHNVLLKSGVTFDQNYTLSIVPIQKFLEVIQKNQPK